MRLPICVRNEFPVGWQLEAHAHPQDHELVLVIGGRIWTKMEGHESIAEPGMVVTHPAGVAHAEASVGGRPLHMLYLGWTARRPEEVPLLAAPVIDSQGRIEAALRWMIDLCATGTTRARVACEGLLEAILQELSVRVRRPEDALVERVRRFAHGQLAAPLQLNDLARAAGLSRHHFARAFRRAAGVPPMDYLRQLRIQRARHLLLTTDLPLVEVARQTGFPDRFHFSRVFARVAGVPPSRLRATAT